MFHHPLFGNRQMNKLIKNGRGRQGARHAAFGAVLVLAHGLAGAAPAKPAAAPAERADSGPHCVGEAARPASMTLQMGKSTLMRLPEPVRYRSVGNPAVAQAMLVAPDTLYLVGVDVGSTNMIIQGRSGACTMVDLVVAMDTAALKAALAAGLPDERNISVSTAGDTIVLSGTVADGPAVARAVELASAFVRKPLRSLVKGEDSGAQAAVDAAAGAAGQSKRVINLLSVNAPQQVMLEVKIAEVSKSLIERLDAGVTWRFSSGSWAATLLSNFLAGNPRGVAPANGVAEFRKSNGNRIGADAQKQDGLVRMLAEPTVMALSGQEGSFLAGGKIFIPVAQDNNKITLEEREFGVGLRFTPTVLSGGRINLKVAPEVSEVSRDGIGITAGSGALAVLPLITTRRANTTVQLYDGQSFAIGGLIKNNLTTGMNGTPGLSEVPVLGALFRSTDYQQDKTEMVFVVTAHLVKPLATYSLPTDVVTAPTRTQLMLNGRIEGDAPPPPASAPPGATGSGFELK
jgi:pilus assembly protein CpaC